MELRSLAFCALALLPCASAVNIKEHDLPKMGGPHISPILSGKKPNFGMHVDYTFTGKRAADVPDAHTEGCDPLTGMRQGARTGACNFKMSNLMEHGNPVNMKSIGSFEETWYQGDTVTYEGGMSVSGLPMPFSMLIPSELPKIRFSCKLCGEMCDLRLSTISPELNTIYEAVKPSVDELWKTYNLPKAKEASRYKEDDLLFKMPPCPLATTKESLLPPDLVNKIEGADISPMAKVLNVLQMVFSNLEVTAFSKVKLARKAGDAVLSLDQKSTVGRLDEGPKSWWTRG